MNNKIIYLKFKSIPIYWKKEQWGLKRNTLREIEDNDERFKILRTYQKKLYLKTLIIQIENTGTNSIFERKITDIYFTNKNQVLISW